MGEARGNSIVQSDHYTGKVFVNVNLCVCVCVSACVCTCVCMCNFEVERISGVIILCVSYGRWLACSMLNLY